MAKTKKQIIELVLDIVCAVLVVILLFVTINSLVQKKDKGAVAYFGVFNMGVKSDSMWPTEANKEARIVTGDTAENLIVKLFMGYGASATDVTPEMLAQYNVTDNILPSFNKGDLVVVKELKDDEKDDLKVGDIITFRFEVKLTDDSGKVHKSIEANTHRIIAVNKADDGRIIGYKTRGDKTSAGGEEVVLDDVLGVVTRVKVNGGGFQLFASSSAGFLVLIVIPSFIVVAYFVVLLAIELKKRNGDKVKVTTEELRAQLEQELREKMMKELEEKMAAEKGAQAVEKDETADQTEPKE